MYILLDKNNYITATSHSKIKGAIEMELPIDFDYNNQGCYYLENNEIKYDENKSKKRYKNELREKRAIILKAFDIYKTNVIYGIEEETQEERLEIIDWYNKLLDLDEKAFNNISIKISRYL